MRISTSSGIVLSVVAIDGAYLLYQEKGVHLFPAVDTSDRAGPQYVRVEPQGHGVL